MRETKEHVQGPGKMLFPALTVAILTIATYAFLHWMHVKTYQDPKNPVNQHPSATTETATEH